MRNLNKFAAVAMLALAPSMASALRGTIITCDPTDGVDIDVSFSPGLDCYTRVNKVKIDTAVDGCTTGTANTTATSDQTGCLAAADPLSCCTGAGTGTCTVLDFWNAAKVAKTAGALGTITNLTVKVGAKTFGSCNFSGSATGANSPGAGAAKVQLLNAAAEAVGKLQAFGTVGGSLATASAVLSGFVTKGFVAGSQIFVQVGINLASMNNSQVLACNTTAVCSTISALTPSPILSLQTSPTSKVVIGLPQNSDCVDASNPYACCTGATTGNC